MAIATTTLTTARAIGQTAVLQLPGTTLDNTQYDYSLWIAGTEFSRRTRCTRTSDASLALAVDSSEVDYSGVSGFHPSRFLRAELLYPGGNAWQTATAYSQYDLATSGGVYYVASSDHTSASATEPGTGDDWEDYWTQVQTDVAFRLRVADYQYVLARLRERPVTLNPVDDTTIYAVAPRDDERVYPTYHIAFRETADEAVFDFVPETAWRLRLYWWEPFTTWTYGTASPDAVTLNIPDDMIAGVIYYGVPCFYKRGREEVADIAIAREQFERHIRRCAGDVAVSRTIRADDSAYL